MKRDELVIRGEEGHLKQDCPQVSKPHLAPGLQRTILEKRLPSKVKASGVRLSRQSGLKVPWGPTQVPVLRCN